MFPTKRKAEHGFLIRVGTGEDISKHPHTAGQHTWKGSLHVGARSDCKCKSSVLYL